MKPSETSEQHIHIITIILSKDWLYARWTEVENMEFGRTIERMIYDMEGKGSYTTIMQWKWQA